MYSFQAQFYDRMAGTQSPAKVEVHPASLEITLENGKKIEWTLADLDSAADHAEQVILQNGKLFLEINDREFRQVFERRMSASELFKPRGFFDKIGLSGCLLTLALLVGLIAAMFIWGIPWLADRAAQKVSPETEREIGDAMVGGYIESFKKDSAKTRLAQEFFEKLNFGGPYKFEITVVREPEMNAFAAPGGRIVVFDSILNMMDRPEELAALFGHEASHVLLRHTTRSVFRELGNSMAVALVFGDFGGVAGLAAEHAQSLSGLAYSRELEIEADENGLKLISAAGVPPSGIVSLLEKMQHNIQKSGISEGKSFFNTHPSTAERINLMQEKVKNLSDAPTAASPELEEIFKKLKAGNATTTGNF